MTNIFWRYTGLEGKQYRKELYQDARLSIDVFLPEWQSAKSSASGCCGEAMIMQIRLVHQSLEKTYCNLMKAVWQTNLMKLFREVGLKLIFDFVENVIYKCSSRKTNWVSEHFRRLCICLNCFEYT